LLSYLHASYGGELLPVKYMMEIITEKLKQGAESLKLPTKVSLQTTLLSLQKPVYRL